MYNVQLKNLADLLSDNHAEITDMMCNECLEEAAKLMEMQAARLLTTADEVREIKRKKCSEPT